MSSPKKTGDKTGRKPGTFVKGDPRAGHGKKGRSGRKSIDFMAECANLADTDVLEACRAKLLERNPDDAGWRWAAEYVSRYTKSEAPKRTVVEGDKDKPLTVVVRHE
jgi:hypothetical protein